VWDLITENGNAARGFIKVNRKVQEAKHWAIKVTDLELLANEGIEVSPSIDEGLQFVDTVGRGLELSHILNMVNDLA